MDIFILSIITFLPSTRVPVFPMEGSGSFWVDLSIGQRKGDRKPRGCACRTRNKMMPLGESYHEQIAIKNPHFGAGKWCAVGIGLFVWQAPGGVRDQHGVSSVVFCYLYPMSLSPCDSLLSL
jgi:hypothetical protein